MNRRPGLMSLSFLFVILILTVLAVFVGNIFVAADAKGQLQNMSDAAANAVGVEVARSMNAITATNHLAGEVQSVSILAYSYGGIELEESAQGGGAKFDLQSHEFDGAFAAAKYWGTLIGVPPSDSLFQKVKPRSSLSGAAIGHSRRDLKKLLVKVYLIWAAAGATGNVALAQAADRIENAVAVEWDTLDRLERLARNTLLPLKWRCNRTIVPTLAAHLRRVVQDAPERLDTTARTVGTKLGGTVTPFPMEELGLPVEPEKDYVRRLGWETSQLVRASTPWVQYHRKPVLAFGEKFLTLSHFAAHYFKWTNHFTPLMARWQADDYDTYLFILKDSIGPKGEQPWAKRDGSKRADELFGYLAITHMTATPRLGPAFFPEPQAHGTTTVAQSMIYNANPQDLRETSPDWQRTVGWDTLNWSPEVRIPEYRYGLRRNPPIPLEEPEIVLNWQARLSPVTRHAEAAEKLTGPVGESLRQSGRSLASQNSQ